MYCIIILHRDYHISSSSYCSLIQCINSWEGEEVKIGFWFGLGELSRDKTSSEVKVASRSRVASTLTAILVDLENGTTTALKESCSSPPQTLSTSTVGRDSSPQAASKAVCCTDTQTSSYSTLEKDATALAMAAIFFYEVIQFILTVTIRVGPQ
jgi:hypothetical protein